MSNQSQAASSSPRTDPAAAQEAGRRLWLVPLLALAITFVLSRNPALHGPGCLSRTLFHIPCPGCGFTRSFVCVWHGDVVGAFRFHPLGLPLFALFAVFVLAAALGPGWPFARAQYRRLCAEVQTGTWFWKGLLACLLGVYAVRVALSLTGSHYFVW